MVAVPPKIIVQLKATGNAPILKQSKFKISSEQRFQTVVEFLRKQLHLEPSQSLFLYVNSAFSPALDEPLSNLYKCFQSDGMLMVNYAYQAAWG